MWRLMFMELVEQVNICRLLFLIIYYNELLQTILQYLFSPLD